MIILMQSVLTEENMLHPLDSFTGDCFNGGEFSYNLPFPLFGLSPGWAWWGVTDWLTTEVDFECWLGGVPSFNLRLKLLNPKGILPEVAHEAMFQFLPDTINQLEDYDYLNVRRKGISYYDRLNLTWRVTRSIRIHLSGGVSYCEYLEIDNGRRSPFYQWEFKNYLEPTFAFGFDWRMSERASFHITGSYGVTFIYLDNVPRKYQLCFGFRLAPFVKSRWGLLRNFRVEFSSINFYFEDAREGMAMIAPIYPYLYWQWGGD